MPFYDNAAKSDWSYSTSVLQCHIPINIIHADLINICLNATAYQPILLSVLPQQALIPQTTDKAALSLQLLIPLSESIVFLSLSFSLNFIAFRMRSGGDTGREEYCSYDEQQKRLFTFISEQLSL